MKLGEVLVRKGLITRAQLKEALDAQLIYGGHLGTCLMELGYVTERRLGDVLAEFLDVGFAPAEYFLNIPRYVTATLTDRVVETHQAVPFRLQDRILDVAMVDPKDLAAQDAISFAAGYKLKTWVAPEARIFQAMERYYDIPRRLRYVTLCREIDRTATSRERATARNRSRERSRTRRRGPLPARRSRAFAGGEPRAGVAPRKPAAAAVTAVAVAEPAQEAVDLLAPLSRQLIDADSVDRVAKLAVDHAGAGPHRCLVFLVRAGRALPWQAAGIRGDASRWSTVSFPVTGEPIFGLLDGEDLYRGPIPQEAPYRQFYKTLEIEMPEEALLVSAHVDDRLVAIFYGDGGTTGKVKARASSTAASSARWASPCTWCQIRRNILNA